VLDVEFTHDHLSLRDVACRREFYSVVRSDGGAGERALARRL
jgi:hypothetical protein